MSNTKKCYYCGAKYSCITLFCEYCGGFLKNVSELPIIKRVSRKQLFNLESITLLSLLIFFFNLFSLYFVMGFAAFNACHWDDYNFSQLLLYPGQIASLIGIFLGGGVFLKVITIKEKIPLFLKKGYSRLKETALVTIIVNSLIFFVFAIELLILYFKCCSFCT